MNKQELIDVVSKNTDMTKVSVSNVVNATIDTIKKQTKKGDSVTLLGFGTFEKRKRKARNGINPSTGEPIKIKAKNVAYFKPGKNYSDYLNPNRK